HTATSRADASETGSGPRRDYSQNRIGLFLTRQIFGIEVLLEAVGLGLAVVVVGVDVGLRHHERTGVDDHAGLSHGAAGGELHQGVRTDVGLTHRVLENRRGDRTVLDVLDDGRVVVDRDDLDRQAGLLDRGGRGDRRVVGGVDDAVDLLALGGQLVGHRLLSGLQVGVDVGDGVQQLDLAAGLVHRLLHAGHPALGVGVHLVTGQVHQVAGATHGVDRRF